MAGADHFVIDNAGQARGDHITDFRAVMAELWLNTMPAIVTFIGHASVSDVAGNFVFND